MRWEGWKDNHFWTSVTRPSTFLCHVLVGGVPSGGDTSLFLKVVKTCERVYQKDVLPGVVKPLNMTPFNGKEWVFQQDSATAHKAKTTHEWLWRKLLAFISAENWPSGSSDLNPLDSKLWAVCFEENGLPKGSQQPGEPKEIPCEGSCCDPMVTVRAVIPEWPEHLKACVEEEGSHFEWHYYK